MALEHHHLITASRKLFDRSLWLLAPACHCQCRADGLLSARFPCQHFLFLVWPLHPTNCLVHIHHCLLYHLSIFRCSSANAIHIAISIMVPKLPPRLLGSRP